MQFRVQRFERVDSTNERALRALEAGSARHADVFVAREQSAGRGRLGRPWDSAPGEGLYFSVVLQHAPPLLAAPLLTMLAGLAAQGALLQVGLGRATLKWPNDILVGDAKLCGILVETRALDPLAPAHVLGFGINVRQLSFRPGLLAERAVTSLWLEGLRCTPDEVLDVVLHKLGQEVEALDFSGALPRSRGIEELESRYGASLGLLGVEVEVESSDARRRGVLRGLTVARGLELEVRGSVFAIALEHVQALRRA